jgi:hypothetical protein
MNDYKITDGLIEIELEKNADNTAKKIALQVTVTTALTLAGFEGGLLSLSNKLREFDLKTVFIVFETAIGRELQNDEKDELLKKGVVHLSNLASTFLNMVLFGGKLPPVDNADEKNNEEKPSGKKAGKP